MPYLKIPTNREVKDDAKQEIMRKAFRAVSKNLGKPRVCHGALRPRGAHDVCGRRCIHAPTWS